MAAASKGAEEAVVVVGAPLTVGCFEEPAILNSFIVGGDLAATGDVTAGILQAPLVPLPDLSFGPQLADGMPKVVSESPLSIEYKLKGLTWSDGNRLPARTPSSPTT